MAKVSLSHRSPIGMRGMCKRSRCHFCSPAQFATKSSNILCSARIVKFPTVKQHFVHFSLVLLSLHWPLTRSAVEDPVQHQDEGASAQEGLCSLSIPTLKPRWTKVTILLQGNNNNKQSPILPLGVREKVSAPITRRAAIISLGRPFAEFSVQNIEF